MYAINNGRGRGLNPHPWPFSQREKGINGEIFSSPSGRGCRE